MGCRPFGCATAWTPRRPPFVEDPRWVLVVVLVRKAVDIARWRTIVKSGSSSLEGLRMYINK